MKVFKLVDFLTLFPMYYVLYQASLLSSSIQIYRLLPRKRENDFLNNMFDNDDGNDLTKGDISRHI